MNVISDPQTLVLSEAEKGFAIDLRHGLGFGARNAMAVQDILRGISLWRLALTLSWLDIRLRYRGSVLGPLWLTLSTAVMVASLGFLYAYLFHTPIRDYLPFLALSLTLWAFLSTIISDGSTAFTAAEGMIRSMRIPFSLYIYQLLARNVLILGHNIIVIVVVFLVFQTEVNVNDLAAIPAFLLWLIDGAAISLVLGALCARFRDIPPIVASVVQIAFYVSGVMYKPGMLGHRGFFLLYDPFFTILEVLRAPLLGTIPSTAIYVSALGFSAILCGIAWLVFLRVRHRVAFWV
ncbi:MAG: ABC transporter permease [Proteobacteria bacterium]|nr:ABC transporter permease [Pseudomonadota bacterium]